MNVREKFSQKVLAWFESHGRKNLPWQEEINPYRVWVSEIMLQQTQVSTVIPYFTRFLDRFPSLASLAEANLDEVLELWTGLGYYARGRNLHRAAKILRSENHGVLPETIEELVKLPGIGRSTAGAIISIGYGGIAPILDGNVKRVLARTHGIRGWPGQSSVEATLWGLAEKYTPSKDTNFYSQAIMDLGATICTRSNPKCTHCPVKGYCIAFKQDNVLDYPGKKPRKALPRKSTIFVIMQTRDNRILLQRRPENGIWGGLWCFPEFRSSSLIKTWYNESGFSGQMKIKTFPTIDHTFSHYKLSIAPALIRCENPEHFSVTTGEWVWYNKQSKREFGLPAPVVKLIKVLKLATGRGIRE